MFEIQASTEFIKSLATGLNDCAELMNDILDHTSVAAELIEIGTRNGSIENMSGKMSALKQKENALCFTLACHYKLLMLVAQVMEKTENKMKNLIPDWAKETFSDPTMYRAEDKKTGRVLQNFDGKKYYTSCTYYTLHRLHERGLGFPFKEILKAHGGQWFSNASDQAIKYPGTDCLDKLFIDYGLNGAVIKNIVVSMGGIPGHVILIDKMYIDHATNKIMIEWSDMINQKPFQRIYGDFNKTNPPITRTLDDFKKFYNWTSINGAVLIGE